MLDLVAAAAACLGEADVDRKIRLSRRAISDAGKGFRLQPGAGWSLVEVGVPKRPRLVAPRDLPPRGFGNESARLSLVHAIAHIEFNAINLAWDAIYRFREMPAAYYHDWLQIAGEETRHFSMLREYLQQRGSDYGAHDAHNGLWSMAQQTAGDVLHRMAIVPRVLEARGLDVTPSMIDKFRAAGDDGICAILEIIYQEEIGHVQIGDRWFKYVCAQRQLDAQSTYIDLLGKYNLNGVPGKINRAARRTAGFSDFELDYLESGDAEGGRK